MHIYTTKSGYKLIQILSGRCNVFLLTDGNKNILIDTSSKRHRNKLADNLKNMGVDKIDLLILTHTHFDHAGNVEFIKRNYHAAVIVHSYEAGCLAKGKNPFTKGTIFPANILSSLFMEKILSKLSYNPCKPDILAEDKYPLTEYGLNAYLLHTPGHSVGSMSLIIDDEIAVVGDTMFGVFPDSVFPPFANNVKELVDSWGKLLETNCKLFLPMHGMPRKRALLEKCYKKRKL